MTASDLPLAVVLAGGAGSRLGGDKATVPVAGRPLVAWPVAALRAALGPVVVVARADTALPAELDAEVWLEPDGERHPVRGIVHALRRADGRDVLVCAVDLPCVRPATIRALATITPAGVPVLARDGAARPQPLLARYPATALAALEAAAPDARLTAVASALGPVLVEVPDEELLNVNAPTDVAGAERVLRRLTRR